MKFLARYSGLPNFLLVLVLFLTLNGITLFTNLRDEITRYYHTHVEDELVLTAQMIQEAVFRHDIVAIEAFLIRWGRQRPDLVEIKAVTVNGFILAHYLRPKPSLRTVTHQRTIYYREEPFLTLEVYHDLDEMEKNLSHFGQRLVIASLVLTSLLGLILWGLLRQFSILPLAQEIEKRRQIEADLQKSQQNYQVIFETVHSMIWLLDREHRVRRVNRLAAEHSQLPPEAVLGKTVFELFPKEFAELYHADNLEVMTTGIPKLGIIEPGTYRDGGTGWFQTDKIPYFDDHDQVAGMTIMVTDITAIKRAELAIKAAHQELRESEARLRAILDNTNAVIFIKDVEGFYLFINRRYEQLFHISNDDVQGKTDFDIFPPEMATAFQMNDRKIIEQGVPMELEERALHDDGPHTYISIKVPLNDSTGSTYGVCGIATDITDRKAMEESLEESRRLAEAATQAKSEFLARMSHDIRTPMNAILGMGEALRDSQLDRKQLDYLNILTQAGEHLLTLINDILDISKIEAGQLQVESIPFDLHEVLNGICAIFQDHANNRGLALNCRIAPTCPRYVNGDPLRLRQIMINLFGNALKFTNEGTISLTVEPIAEPFMRFSVADTGAGISAESLPDIFIHFHQGDKSVCRHFGGTGLGLSICRELIGLMGGTIQVESVVEQGSVFRFELPLPLASQPVTTNQADVSSQMAPVPAGLSILLVDDVANNLAVIVAFLANSPHRLVMASNGHEAVEAYQRERFDLILMDMIMPVMDGLEATRRIRAWENEQALPPTTIVALTANAMKEDIEKAITAGCDDHLSKPIRKARLLELINGIQNYPTATTAPPVAEKKSTSIDWDALQQLHNELDEEFEPILLNFQECLPQYLAAISEALAHNNLKEVVQTAHALKGVAANMCVPKLANLAAALEKTAKNGYLPPENEALRPLCDESNLVQTEFSSLLGTHGRVGGQQLPLR